MRGVALFSLLLYRKSWLGRGRLAGGLPRRQVVYYGGGLLKNEGGGVVFTFILPKKLAGEGQAASLPVKHFPELPAVETWPLRCMSVTINL